MVKKLVQKLEKVSGKGELCTVFVKVKNFAQKFARVLLVDLHLVLHKFSRVLAIDFFLYFFDLITKGEIKF